MKITPNILKREFIGLESTISQSSHFDYIGLRGKVIKETKNTFTILHNTKPKNIIKNSAIFRFKLYDGQTVEIDGREICAIARYAGISNRVTSFGVYELKNFNDARSGAMLVAQIFWYFIEGVNFRIADDDFNDSKHYTTYKVPIDDDILVFKKSDKTGRWWIELPFILNVNNKLKSRTLLPCTYGEYLSACNQEIPERWFKARRKNEV